MPNILELLLQQQPTGNNRNQPIYAPLDQGLIQSLISQTANAQQNSQNQASKGQAWIDAHDIPAAELMRGSMNDVSNIQGYQARAAEMAKPNGFIGNALKQVVGGATQQWVGNKLQEFMPKDSIQQQDNALYDKLMGQPNTIAGAGEWHAPLRQGETIQGNGTGYQGGKLSMAQVGQGLVTGAQDPHNQAAGRNMLQYGLEQENKNFAPPTGWTRTQDGQLVPLIDATTGKPAYQAKEDYISAKDMFINNLRNAHDELRYAREDAKAATAQERYELSLKRQQELDQRRLDNEERIAKNQNFSAANALRDDYNKQATSHQNYITAYNQLGTVFNKPNTTAADDMAGIYMFMRSLDPTSTVREGEFASAQNAAGVDDRLRNLYNQALSGNRLTLDQRLGMLSVAKGFADNAQTQINKLQQEYGGRAERYGVDKRDVFGGSQAPQAPQAPINPLDFKRAGKSYQEYLNAVRGR